MFGTRLLSSIALLVAAFLAVGVGGAVLALALLIISLIAYRELTRAFSHTAHRKMPDGMEAVGLIGVLLYYGMLYFWREPWLLFMGIAGVFLAELYLYVFAFPKYHASQVVVAVFSFLYAPVMLSFVYLTRSAHQGIFVVWTILISSWGCDTCAYAVGKLIGKTKIFPELSPNKSLEGCIGGVLGAALLGGLYGHFQVEAAFPHQTVAWMIALICGAGAIMSIVGDLAASGIKRNYGIKDYGSLIPGHGGIMDRFDSMTVTAPMTYFLALLLLKM